MKLFKITILLLMCMPNLYAQNSIGKKENLKLKNLDGKLITIQLNEPVAFVFLSPECPLSKNYVSVLNKLQEKYAQVKIYGVFSGKQDVKQLKKFQQDYQIKFWLLNDPLKQLVHQYHATVTPQVFFINSSGDVLYSGLIDNWPISLGKQRQVTTKYYLDDAISLYLQHKEIVVRSTEPIGCLIDDDI